MPGTPKDEAMIARVQATLRGINGGATYHNDFTDTAESVSRRLVKEPNVYPSIIAYYLETTATGIIGYGSADQYDSEFRFNVQSWVEDGETLETTLALLVHDVKVAIEADCELGGLAKDTHWLGDKFYLIGDGRSRAVAETRFVSQYMVSRADPTTGE